MLIPHGKFHIHISPAACLLFALLILELPIQWLFAAAVAASFHELCHALAVRICHGRLETIHIGHLGAQIRAEISAPAQELLCTLAGPFSALLLLLFVRYIPRIAICAAVHSLYNLLPFPQLDGGRALSILLRMIHPETADRICKWVQLIFIGFSWTGACYLSFFCGFGIMPLIFALSVSAAAKKTLQTMHETGTIV